jgi:hypothetical protein
MEFIKRGDITDIIYNSCNVGYIKTDRNSRKRVLGYSIRFYSEIWGCNFGEYANTYKDALKRAGIQYNKMLQQLNVNIFYSKELDMYFPDEGKYVVFNKTIVAEQRRKDVLKRLKS